MLCKYNAVHVMPGTFHCQYCQKCIV